MHPVLKNSVYKLVNSILESGELSGFRAAQEFHSGGRYVQALEKVFCDFFQVEHAIALNSATAALHAALIACDIGKGDEVIVSPYSFSASASCVLMVGAKPVFADIREDIFCIDANKIEPLLTKRTKAIIPVHLCGHPATMSPIMKLAKHYRLYIIEDAAQSIGASYHYQYAGTIGDCGIFSFNQSKHISTGEGGMLITKNAQIAEIVKAVRNHAEVSVPDLKIVGYNYRLCEIEATLALSQMEDLKENNLKRAKLAQYLSEQLRTIAGLTPPTVYPKCTHVYYTYPVRLNTTLIQLNKRDLCQKLNEQGAYFGTYVKPLYLLPIYEQFGYRQGLCPVAERMWEKELIVTDIIRPTATEDDMDKIAEAFRKSML